MTLSSLRWAKPNLLGKALPLILSGAFLLSSGMAHADTTPFNLAGGNLSQDWSNTNLITTNNDWSGVPSITGFRGDNLTNSTTTDPQTTLGVGSGTDNPINVVANQTNPNTNTTGAVAEFDGIPNPTVAFQGSGTADAPNIVIYLNTVGRENVNVSYLLRDIDGSADNSVQRVALQYRVGGTGNFVNIPEGYVADASSGPSLATLETPVSVVLPAAANGQSLVEVRVITNDAVGADEWIGIDNINVTSSASTGATPTPSPTPNGTPTPTPTPTTAPTATPSPTPTATIPPQVPVYFSLASGPLVQDWSNANLITANDNWINVPSIIGYLGDVSGTVATYTDGTLGTVDVIANQSVTTISNGGVAEFDGIPNPTVALQGSGTANIPGLVFYLNATGRQNVTFACNLRDIDGSADNSVQPILVQYRVGTTGSFTTISTTADASEGPSLATLVTPISVVLPSDANNQAQVEVRVITGNAVGNDEWIGIDDINITSSALSGNAATTGAIISEYRPSGPNGVSDEYVEIYNISGAPLNISGWQINAGTTAPGTTIFTFPENTIIPARGHYLVTGTGYSLGSYAAGNNATALGADSISDSGSVGLLNTSGTTVDAAGVAGFIEGAPLPASPGPGVEYAYVRKVLPGGTGHPLDTGNNSSDFFLVSTTATSATASPRLGAPGPENLASPIQTNGALSYESIFQFRQNAPGGTLTLRRRMTNTSSVTLSNLKLRVVEATAGTGTTANTPIASGNGSTAPGVNGAPALPTSGSIGFVSLTLEAPSPTGNGGVNSTLSAGAITLLPGQSVDVEYTLNVLTGGTYRVVTSFETNF